MSIAHPIYADFSAGEESPRMYGRTDLPAYTKGARIIENLVPHIQGGLERRPGTIHVGDCDSHTVKGRLIPWQGPIRQYMLELAVSKIKIWRVDTGALVHTITVTTWTEAQIPEIDWDFDGSNLMYFVHPDWKPKKLVHNTETNDTDWTLTENPTFTVTGYTDTNLFNAANKYPSLVCFFQGRMIFASTYLYPNLIWFSNAWNVTTGVNAYETFASGTPSNSTSFSVNPGFSRGGKIKWLAGRNALVGGSTSGEFIVGSGENGITALYPGDIKNYSFFGGSNRKLRVGDGVLFVQRGRKKLRELIVTQAAQYIANDLMVVSDHIAGPGIKDIDFQMLPNPRIYCTRDDGEVAVLTYEASLEMKAWSRFITGTYETLWGDSQDSFECFAVTQDSDGYDNVWCMVERYTSNGTRRYIERFAGWGMEDWVDFRDAIYVDNSTTVDHGDEIDDIASIDFTTLITVNTTSAHGLIDGDKIRFTGNSESKLLGVIYTVQYIDTDSFSLRNEADSEDIDATQGLIFGTGDWVPASWQVGDTLTGNVSGNTATIQGIPDANTVYFGDATTYDPFATDTSVTNGTDPVSIGTDPVSYALWDDSIDTDVDGVEKVQKEFTGYTRYAGRTIQIFADSIVQPPVEVDDAGDFEIAQYANHITFGLSYRSLLLLMPIEAGISEGTAQGKRKRIDKVVIRLKDSLGYEVGQTLDNLVMARFRQTTAVMGEVTQPQDGDIEVSFPGDYETFGDLYVSWDEPLPLTIVSVMPRIETTE